MLIHRIISFRLNQRFHFINSKRVHKALLRWKMKKTHIFFIWLKYRKTCFIDSIFSSMLFFIMHYSQYASIIACNTLNNRNKIVFIDIIRRLFNLKCVIYKVRIIFLVRMSMSFNIQTSSIFNHYKIEIKLSN